MRAMSGGLNLEAALTNDDMIKAALVDYIAWRFFCEEFATLLIGPLPEEIEFLIEDGWYLANLSVTQALNRNDAKCASCLVRNEKIALITKLWELNEFIDLCGLDVTPLGHDSLCGGAMKQPDSISIDPSELNLRINESNPLKAIALNYSRIKIPDSDLTLSALVHKFTNVFYVMQRADMNRPTVF